MDSPFALLGVFAKNALWLGAAMTLAAAGLGLAHTVNTWLGVVVAFCGALLLYRFMEDYVALLQRQSANGYRLMRAMAVLAIPLNGVVFAINGPPPDLFEDPFLMVGMLGWGTGGMLVLCIALLRPRPAP